MQHRKSLPTYIGDVLNHPRLTQGPLAWYIIAGATVLFLVPYFLPGMIYAKLSSYGSLATVPMVVGAMLRARKGSIILNIAITVAMGVIIQVEYGLPWPHDVFASWAFGNLAGFFFALTVGQFGHMARQLRLAHRALQQQAATDGLTGLPNHRALMEAIAKECSRAQRSGKPFAVIFFDGDHFKQVNDTYGHSIGDSVLRELGERARSVLRKNDTLGRYGGEEFVALLPETDSAEATILAQRMRAAIAATPLAQAEIVGGLSVTISVGVACFPHHAATLTDILEAADQAMYHAKQQGRNQVFVAGSARTVAAPADHARAEIAPTSSQLSDHEQLAAALLWLLAQHGYRHILDEHTQTALTHILVHETRLIQSTYSELEIALKTLAKQSSAIAHPVLLEQIATSLAISAAPAQQAA